MRRVRLLSHLAAFVAALTLVVVSVPTSAVAAGLPITGTGSTWSQNALDQWRRNVSVNYGMTVNYTGVGSSTGRRDFIDDRVDFAVSEIPFQRSPEDSSAPEIPSRGYAYMPIVAGGTAFMYHLRIGGKRVTNLRLAGATIAGIFSGRITNWNDAAIAADNPGLTLPDKPIVPVVRSDGSGTSAQFTLWMSKQHPDIWTQGMRSQFPTPSNGKAQNGSLGVAGYVSQDYGDGAITYVEYSYALKSNFPVAKVLNSSGYYIEPKASAVAVALLQSKINNDPASPDYLTQILDGVYNNADPRTYPLSSYSYMIVPTQTGGIFTEQKGQTLGEFARYFLCEGQQQAEALGYSPLPMNLVLAGAEQVKRIPGAGASAIDVNACNNPTFKPGDSPSNNQLALTAAQPAECDRQGPAQCTAGTGGAQEETPVSPGASGGAAGGAGAAAAAAAGAADAGAADAAGVAVGSASEPVYDANGNLVSGGGVAGVGGASAASAPFAVPESGLDISKILMIAAAVLLLAGIALPPVLSARLRRAGGVGGDTPAR